MQRDGIGHQRADVVAVGGQPARRVAAEERRHHPPAAGGEVRPEVPPGPRGVGEPVQRHDERAVGRSPRQARQPDAGQRRPRRPLVPRTHCRDDGPMPAERPPLWVCPACGRAFANLHQSHACGPLDLAHHLEGRSDAVRATYAAFLALLEENGPVTVLPEKTRIAFQVRMSFAQLTLRKEWALGHLVLARRVAGRGVHQGRDLLAAQPPARVPARRSRRGREAAAVDPRGLRGRLSGPPRAGRGPALGSPPDGAQAPARNARSAASSSVSSGVVGWNLAARMSR